MGIYQLNSVPANSHPILVQSKSNSTQFLPIPIQYKFNSNQTQLSFCQWTIFYKINNIFLFIHISAQLSFCQFPSSISSIQVKLNSVFYQWTIFWTFLQNKIKKIKKK